MRLAMPRWIRFVPLLHARLGGLWLAMLATAGWAAWHFVSSSHVPWNALGALATLALLNRVLAQVLCVEPWPWQYVAELPREH